MQQALRRMLGRTTRPPAANGTPTLPSSVPPYLRGRAEFDSVFGDLARGKRNWQLVAFGSLGVSALLAGGLVTLATQSRITPYVVEVDRLGRAQAFGPAERLHLTDQRVVTSQLAAFVRDLRVVVGDHAVQGDLVRRAYAFADQSAATFLNTYFGDVANDPRLLGRDQSRIVEVTSVLPVPGPAMAAPNAGAGQSRKAEQGSAGLPATWKVTWTETTIPRALGGAPEVSAWEGYLTTRLAPPRDAERITVNPLGLYVTSVTWTRLSVRDARTLGESRLPDGADGSPDTASQSNQPVGTPAQSQEARP